MSDFIVVGSIDEFEPDGEPIVVDINRRWVAIFNCGGDLYAIEDRCTHDDGPLADGKVAECVVACPRHGARFDLRTGKLLSGPAGTVDVPTYEVKVADGQVMVRQSK